MPGPPTEAETGRDTAPQTRPARPRRRLAWSALAAVGLAASGWLGFGWYQRTTLAEALALIAEKRRPEALSRLTRLQRWAPGSAEVELPLGDCLLAAGRVDDAVAAWSRVPADSPSADEAALRRADAELDRGRLSAAERTLADALARAGPHARASDLRHDLLQVLWQQGRLDEVRGLIEQNWREHVKILGASSPQAVSNLRAHLSLDLEVFPIGRASELLDRAAKLAPDDPRVALGRAGLALRLGRTDEARKTLSPWLSGDADAAVWRCALDLSAATDDSGLASRAARALRVGDLPPRRVDRARAWFAARRGDAAGERAAWSDLLERDPADVQALERLSELEIAAGRPDRAAALRNRKTDLDRTRRLYGNRVAADFQSEAVSLAAQAETLNRLFEARAFLALARTLRPDDAGLREQFARLGRDAAGAADPQSRLTLAEVVGPLPDVPAAAEAARDADAPAFDDAAESAGLVFAFGNGRSPLRQLPETMSGGVGLIDHDGDGWLDVYCVQGGTFPPDPKSPSTGDRLFLNRRDGTFEDVSERTGIAGMPRGYGHGVAVGDVDGDGRADVFVTRWRSYALYRNVGGQRFEDVTQAWGLGGDRDWPTSAALADLDGDGDLDLYVCHYITWNADDPRVCGTEGGGPPSYCAPHLLPHAVDHVFRNDGGKFSDVSAAAGVAAADTDGRGLGVVAADLDGDGKTDVFVANDGTANLLFRNLGGFRFEETGLTAGVAANAEGGYQAGMGVACGDVDGDGAFDLVVTNFYGESTSYFHSLGPGLFGDRSARVGLRDATRYLLGFGTALADVDNDGRLDLATSNGHVNDSRPVIPYAMPAQLLLGTRSGRMRDVSTSGAAGPAWAVPRVGRGLAAGDLDNDGRIDFVIVDQDGPLALLRNRGGPTANHFVTFALEGTASNRDAVGANVAVTAGGTRRVAQRTGGGSYQSANDPRLHFGLGASTTLDAEVRWPSGRVDTYRGLKADTGYRLREGSKTAAPLAGFGKKDGP